MDEKNECITIGGWIKYRVSQLYKSYRFDQHAGWQNHLAAYLPPLEPYGVLFALAEIVGRRVHFRKITFYERSDKFSYSLNGDGRDFADTISSYCQGNSLVGGGTKERGVILYHIRAKWFYDVDLKKEIMHRVTRFSRSLMSRSFHWWHDCDIDTVVSNKGEDDIMAPLVILVPFNISA